MPGSDTTGVAAGADIIAPPSPHGPQAGPHAGSCAGMPQAGWHGCGAAHGVLPPMHGERNSMKEGRRQLFELPKQLLHPGAAARLPRAITRHKVRDMFRLSTTVGTTRGPRSDTGCVVHDDATQPYLTIRRAASRPASRTAARRAGNRAAHADRADGNGPEVRGVPGTAASGGGLGPRSAGGGRVARLPSKLRRAGGMDMDRIRSSIPAPARRLALAVVLWACSCSGIARAETSTPRPEAAACAIEDVWVVSTRGLPDICRPPARLDARVERLAPGGSCGRWEPADLASLLDDPGRPLLVFIHGNRYDPASAKAQGRSLARLCAACGPPGAPPVRTVIFSWPSSQEGFLLRDIRAKYERARSEGFYLATLLGAVGPERPVAVVGYSYGALISLEGLKHLCRTGEEGAEGACWIDRPGRVHLVLVAAAAKRDSLAPGGEYRQALCSIDRLTLLENTCDGVLRFFEFIDRSLRTKALGHDPIPARWIPPTVEFRQFDAAPAAGRSHSFPFYLEHPALRARIASGALDGLTE